MQSTTLFCSECLGTADKNKQGEHEGLISCSECGSSVHPSCLKRMDKTVPNVEDEWLCIECKSCNICGQRADLVRQWNFPPSAPGSALFQPALTTTFFLVDSGPVADLHVMRARFPRSLSGSTGRETTQKLVVFPVRRPQEEQDAKVKRAVSAKRKETEK